MPLDHSNFMREFDRFRERIWNISGDHFNSFQDGFAGEEEGYKKLIWECARDRLAVTEMHSDAIGDGSILERLISSIEIRKTLDTPENNLVGWHDRYGPRTSAHNALIDARTRPEVRRSIEAWAFEFYRDEIDHEQAFDTLQQLVGRRYPLIAYLFFVKDMRLYMPIAPETFDRAFEKFKIDVRTSGKCSWSNYRAYNQALQEIRTALIELSGITDATLFDAHSFCWLLTRDEYKRENTIYGPIPPRGAIEVAISRMVATALATVKYSNGQLILARRKEKTSDMDEAQLTEYVRELWYRQSGKCNLTNIPLQLAQGAFDHQLLPSLDRIDSNGGYSKENLQIVCKFVNKWKSDLQNSEFTRLIGLVRGQLTDSL